MAPKYPFPTQRGPFRVDGLQEGGYYELSHGHPIQLAPAGGRHGNANITGALPLATDPMTVELGVDVGHRLTDDTLRAPDLSVGGVAAKPGFVHGAPLLAVEYADMHTDEQDLQLKVQQLFTAGTKFVWVVRLVGPHRVEVYEPGLAPKAFSGDSPLTAPGVLQESVPAAALYDRSVALHTSLRNLLLRAGYRDLDALRNEGREEGREEGLLQGLRLAILDLCEAYELPLSEAQKQSVQTLPRSALESLRETLKRERRWPTQPL